MSYIQDKVEVPISTTGVEMACSANEELPIAPGSVIASPSAEFKHRSITSNQTTPAYSIFSKRQKLFLVFIASWSASFSPISAQIYFPAITDVATDLRISAEMVNISITLYMIFQGLAPSFWGPLSDHKGRRIVILSTFTVYIGACIGLALTQNFVELLVFRSLQSTGSASTIAIGSGILGDITTREERGGYMGIFQAALNVPMAVGPIIGGAMAQKTGWHSIFWLLAAYSGVFLIFAVILLPETLRSIVGDGSIMPKSWTNRCPLQSVWTSRSIRSDQDQIHSVTSAHKLPKFSTKNAIRPLTLLRRRNVSLSVAFLSLHYTVWQMTVTATATLYGTEYGLTVLQIGLTFIANGVGCLLGSLVLGRFLDKDYARLKKRWTDEMKPFSIAKARLRFSWVYSVLQILSTIIFGWTVDKKFHIALPIAAMFFITIGCVSIQGCVTTFLVDNYPEEGASVTATLNLTRCLLGAAGTAVILPLTKAISIGWSFTLFSLILALSNPIAALLLIEKPRDSK